MGSSCAAPMQGPLPQVPHPSQSRCFFSVLGAANFGLPAQSRSEHRTSTGKRKYGLEHLQCSLTPGPPNGSRGAPKSVLWTAIIIGSNSERQLLIVLVVIITSLYMHIYIYMYMCIVYTYIYIYMCTCS